MESSSDEDDDAIEVVYDLDDDDDLLPSIGVYCIIITHPCIKTQKDFHVSLAHNPLRATALHNQRRSAARDLREAAPFCYPIRITGPFFHEGRAKQFADELVHGTRGLASLCRRMENLSGIFPYFVPCYSIDVALEKGDSLYAFLERGGAPREYLEAVERLEEAKRVLLLEAVF